METVTPRGTERLQHEMTVLGAQLLVQFERALRGDAANRDAFDPRPLLERCHELRLGARRRRGSEVERVQANIVAFEHIARGLPHVCRHACDHRLTRAHAGIDALLDQMAAQCVDALHHAVSPTGDIVTGRAHAASVRVLFGILVDSIDPAEPHTARRVATAIALGRTLERVAANAAQIMGRGDATVDAQALTAAGVDVTC